MPTILIIEDEPVIRTVLSHHFTSRGWEVAAAADGRQGLELAREHAPDIVLLDIRLPDMSGMDVLKQLRAQGGAASVVMMTAWGTIEDAVEAIRQGAEQYLTKPVQLTELDALMERTLDRRRLLIENRYYRERMDHPVIGVSLAAQRLHHMIDLMAENAHTTVLLAGESGTGKELAAREIHRRSPRRDRPFLDINCAGLPGALIESELFGHERGAFTDAREMKRGLFEVADGGTVFLDEVGEMPPGVQPKLLRVLETRSFKRVGGTRDVAVDVRIIAASNRDLAQGVKEGWFREDLYYRLSVFPVALPPLRERPEDIPALADYFLNRFTATLNKSVTGFTPDAMDALTRYRWPGNIRELRNIVERAVVLASGGLIGPEFLPKEISDREEAGAVRGMKGRRGVSRTLEDVEREHIQAVLAGEQGNRSRTARSLGISRSTLLEKMKKYGIDQK